MSNKRDAIRSFLKLEPAATDVPLVIETSTEEEGYRRSLVTYSDRHGHPIPAYLFEPTESATGNGVVALHQHNSRWDIGKSEVAGLDGDPLQAFGPALARRGISVLAPAAIGCESRRDTAPEIPDVAPPIENPRNSIENWLQYYNHAMHRIAAAIQVAFEGNGIESGPIENIDRLHGEVAIVDLGGGNPISVHP